MVRLVVDNICKEEKEADEIPMAHSKNNTKHRGHHPDP